ncbi:MAG: DUF5808 domain-containing protein [Gemmatimonadaceae bacterium]
MKQTSTETSVARELANAEQWADVRNWRGGLLGIYVAPRDSRLLVPKRSRLGLTINFGRPLGAVAIISVIGLLIIAHYW